MKPLEGIRVVEAATLFAAPIAGMLLGDYGADVIKIEHPRRPDPARGHGPNKDDVGLWFKTLGRNKRLVTLDLSQPDGRDIFLRLAERSDVVLENFRPGTLERWGLGWDELSAVNPRLVLARVSGFGQTGPYAGRPGFGTLAEAMSGFAALNGEPDGPRRAERHRVDGPPRDGPDRAHQRDEPRRPAVRGRRHRSSHNAPRNVYRSSDDAWVAVSASATSIAERVLKLVGREDLAAQPWFATGAGRVAHIEEIDAAVAGWIGERTREEVLAAFEAAEAAIAPIYDARDLLTDPQLAAIDAIVSIDDDELGAIKMTNMISRLSETPGAIERTGRAHGADTAEVLAEVGVDDAELARLRAGGVV